MSRRATPYFSLNAKLPALLCCAALFGVACANPERVTGKKPDSGGTLLIRSQSDTAAGADTLLTGDEHWLDVDGVDSTTTTPVTWSIADTTIVRIVARDRAFVRVRAVKIGETTITAKHDGETGTFPLVVRDMLPSDTIPRVGITTRVDSVIVGDSLPFGFNMFNKKFEFFFDRPYTITLSDSSVVQVVSVGSIHSFWIAAKKLGQTYIKVSCACIGDSIRIRVHEPPPTIADPRASRYEAIDLGTLGGVGAVPFALNDSGDVVGYSLTADGRQHAFLWSKGVMQDLSPGEQQSVASVVTNSRVVAGTSVIGGTVHIIRWENGQATDLGSVGPSDQHAEVIGITPTDIVAWGDSGSAIWQNGVKHFLSGFRAHAVNSRHQIAGRLYNLAYIWDNGDLRPLEQHGRLSDAIDINTSGAVVGEYLPPWGPQIVVWIPGQTPLPLTGIHSVAINDGGNVVGAYSGEGAFYLPDGPAWRVPHLGEWGTVIKDLNDQRMVVGSSWTPAKKQHAFIWQAFEETAVDLGTGPITIDRTGSSATAVNARGDIIGWVAPCTTPSGRCTDLVQTQARAILWRLKN